MEGCRSFGHLTRYAITTLFGKPAFQNTVKPVGAYFFFIDDACDGCAGLPTIANDRYDRVITAIMHRGEGRALNKVLYWEAPP